MGYKIIRVLSLLICIFFISALLNAQDWVKVKRVIDGDTLLLTNGEKVRLIGVDTPETKHPQKPVERFGKEAYLFTQRMVEGKEVRLVLATIEKVPNIAVVVPCQFLLRFTSLIHF